MKKMWKKMKNDVEAISPVVATLMLVLVAVASVTAFYIWQSSWQKGVTDNIGDTDVQNSLTIGGSSTVYDFSTQATTAYMNAHPDFKISVTKGGSGAGLQAIGKGTIDIGSISDYAANIDPSYATKYPDLNGDGKADTGKTLVATIVAWDAVVVTVPTANVHGLQSINAQVLTDVYGIQGAKSGYTNQFIIPGTSGVQWNEVPVYSQGKAAFLNYSTSGGKAVYNITASGSTTFMNSAGNMYINGPSGGHVLVSAVAVSNSKYNVTAVNASIPFKPSTVNTQVAVTIWECARDSGATANVNIFGRSDDSGTQECFYQKLCQKTLGTKGTLSGNGITVAAGKQSDSNQALITLIAADPNALAFTSHAMSTSANGLFAVTGSGAYNGIPWAADNSTAPVLPSTANIQNTATGVAGGYYAVRPLIYLTIGAPAGAAAAFIDYCLIPENNKLFAPAAGYYSIFW